MEIMTYILGTTAFLGFIQLVVLTKRYSNFFLDEKIKEKESRLEDRDT